MSIEVSNETISDILTTALEGGINYWCKRAEILYDTLPRGVEAVYASDVIALGGSIKLYDIDSEETWILDPKSFEKGIKQYLKDNSSCITDGEIDAGVLDAGDADQIIQYSIFSELMFG